MQCFDSDRQEQIEMQQFREIVSKIRERCPWDKMQTHQSLGNCMIDETAEALVAVKLYETMGDSENLCEELGDLLFLILLQSQIAEEEGIFTLDDVIQTVSDKMIRRHPHVFGTANVSGSGDVITAWEDIKKQEKAGKEWMEDYLPEAFLQSRRYLEQAEERKKQKKEQNRESNEKRNGAE